MTLLFMKCVCSCILQAGQATEPECMIAASFTAGEDGQVSIHVYHRTGVYDSHQLYGWGGWTGEYSCL